MINNLLDLIYPSEEILNRAEEVVNDTINSGNHLAQAQDTINSGNLLVIIGAVLATIALLVFCFLIVRQIRKMNEPVNNSGK